MYVCKLKKSWAPAPYWRIGYVNEPTERNAALVTSQATTIARDNIQNFSTFKKIFLLLFQKKINHKALYEYVISDPLWKDDEKLGRNEEKPLKYSLESGSDDEIWDPRWASRIICILLINVV